MAVWETARLYSTRGSDMNYELGATAARPVKINISMIPSHFSPASGTVMWLCPATKERSPPILSQSNFQPHSSPTGSTPYQALAALLTWATSENGMYVA